MLGLGVMGSGYRARVTVRVTGLVFMDMRSEFRVMVRASSDA